MRCSKVWQVGQKLLVTNDVALTRVSRYHGHFIIMTRGAAQCSRRLPHMQGRSAAAKIGVCNEWRFVGGNRLRKAPWPSLIQHVAGLGV